MPWPHYIVNPFLAAADPYWPELLGAPYDGPYNSLLSYLFLALDSQFVVAPRPWDAVLDSEVIHGYEVMFHNKPVFILEVFCPAELEHSSTRHNADHQIRQKMEELRGKVVLVHISVIADKYG